MEFVRSCIFPKQPLWRPNGLINAPPMEGSNCYCGGLMDKVDRAIQIYFKKGTLLEMTREEIEFLPSELMKRSAKQEIHKVWDNLPEHAKKNLEDHRICEKHLHDEFNERQSKLVVDCWFCRAERESEEIKNNDGIVGKY